MTPPQHLFVYGTLRPGHAPAGVAPFVDRCAVVGAGRTRGRLYDLGNYPGCIIDRACPDAVHGFVLQIPDETVLAKLDAYEGFKPDDLTRSLFVRTCPFDEPHLQSHHLSRQHAAYLEVQHGNSGQRNGGTLA